jgi:hypothetical protein
MNRKKELFLNFPLGYGKKIILFGLIIWALFASAVSGVRVLSDLTALPITNMHVMKVSMINQMPDPVEPGKYVDIRFKFENNGSKTAENVEAEILPQYPFSLDPGTSAVKSLGSINAQQKGDRGIVIKYRLRVDKDALEGESEIKLRYRENGGVWITMPEFKINIQPYDAILVLDKVVSNPKTIKPGEKATIGITFKNMAEILLKKIRVKIDLGAAQLAPIGSTNEKVIQTIDKGENARLVFDVMGEPDAIAGVYSVPIQFLYYDNLGNSYNRNSTIGLIVGSEPDLSVNIDSTTIYQAEKPGDVTIKIVNKDVNEIKFLNINLAESEDYTIISPSEVYVGNIDSDDYETAEFTLFVKNKKDKKIALPLHLEYRDPNNKLYAENIKLELPLYDTSEAKQLGLVQSNHKAGFFIIVLIIVVGLFIYRRRRKGKRRKE